MIPLFVGSKAVRDKEQSSLVWVLESHFRKVSPTHMRVPDSAEQIIQFAENHELNETAVFDAKAPDALDNTKEMAKDIAAMSTDGGVILYGVGEDEYANPTVLQPFELTGTEERISNVVQTCIQPPPQFEVIPFPLDDDPSEGFIAVRVPPSPEAPHMVTKNNDSRYYGRNGPRNVRLQAGEVERLFRQREQLSDDRQSLLEELGDHATIKPGEEREDIGYMRIALQPAFSGDGLLESVLNPADGKGTRNSLNELVRQADDAVEFSWGTGDSFVGTAQWSKELSGYKAYLMRGPERRGKEVHIKRFDAWLGFDGEMYFTIGGIAKEGPKGKAFLEGAAVKVATKFLYFAGLVYKDVGYGGAVDIALKVSGIKGALSGHLGMAAFRENTLETDEEMRDTRSYVATLTDDPKSVARSLLGRLVDVSSMGHADEIFEQDTEEN